MKKLSWPYIGLGIGILCITVLILRFTDSNIESNEVQKSKVLSENFIESTKVDSLHYESITPLHLIDVKITPYIKYRSQLDTLITVYDTLGNIEIPTFRFRELMVPDQYRVREIILTAK